MNESPNGMSDAKLPTEDETRRSRRRFRQFRWWGKKRGSRQTGSSKWGAAGETIFFAALFLVGVVTLTELVSLRVIGGTENFLTSSWGLSLSILMLGSLIVVGAVGAIYSVALTGTSAERRAAIAQRATNSELLSEVQRAPKVLPCIPDDSNWKNSPGIRLAYRLPSASSPVWRLVIVASFCLLWNGAVAVFAVLAFNQGDGQVGTRMLGTTNPPLFYAVILIYAVIGAWAMYRLTRMLRAATAIGPTNVEISSLPLYPGERCDIFLTQAGHLKIEWLEVRLACDEKVSFSDGTDTRTETKRVYDEPVFRRENFGILPNQPFQLECPLDVPPGAMHSFVASNNAVTWKLTITAATRKWPTFERVFPLVLHPSNEPSSEATGR